MYRHVGDGPPHFSGIPISIEGVKMRNHVDVWRKIASIVWPIFAVISLVLTLSFSSVSWAATSLPPLSSFSNVPVPPGGIRAQDSCFEVQYGDTTLPGVFQVNLRGLAVTFIGPTGWNCVIADGNGSGATVSMAFTKGFSYGPQGMIQLHVSASVFDNGANFCPYTTALASMLGGCHGRAARPLGEEVQYLYGDGRSNAFAVLVADPKGAPTPYSGVATTATATVLAASRNGAAYDFVCTFGSTLSKMCITDARQFATSFSHSAK